MKGMQNLLSIFRQNRLRLRRQDGVSYYWTVVTLVGSLLSILVLPFDFRFLDVPYTVPIVVRSICALCLLVASALPLIFRNQFSARIFPSALILCVAVMAYSVSFLETFAIKTMYYNALWQLFVACAFMRVSLPVAVTVYALPVIIYRLVAGPGHFEAAQPEILLLTVVGFAVNQGLRAADARRMQKVSHDTLVAWARAAAHELKGPLITIRMIAHESQRFENNPTLLVDALTEISQLCTRGLAVQNRIMLNARYQQPDGTESTPFFVGTAIQRAVADYTFRDSEHQSLVSVLIEPDFQVMGDALLFENVINNLLANSMRAITTHGSGRIHIVATIEDGRGRIEFSDTVGGIEPWQIPKIFEPGITYSGGQGFGLAFCRTMIVSLGGQIHCESRPGESTTFIVLLPCV